MCAFLYSDAPEIAPPSSQPEPKRQAAGPSCEAAEAQFGGDNSRPSDEPERDS